MALLTGIKDLTMNFLYYFSLSNKNLWYLFFEMKNPTKIFRCSPLLCLFGFFSPSAIYSSDVFFQLLRRIKTTYEVL